MSPPPSRIAWRRMPTLALILVITLWTAWESLRLISADMVSLGARRQIGQWIASATAEPSPEALAKLDTALHAALAITPENPSLHEQVGDLHLLLARVEDDTDAHQEAFRKATTSYLDAIALRPRDPQTWAGLAMAYQGIEGQDEAVISAWRRSRELGPNEGHTQPMLLDIALRMWNGAPADMQEWAQRFYADGAPRQRKAINLRASAYGIRFVAEDEEEAFAEEQPTQGEPSSMNHR